MADINNSEKLENYLVGADGYLLNQQSHSKVIMLSGEWGSGKTHFWQTSIMPKLNNSEKANIYISLYGKMSLQEIESEVFIKAYYKSLGRDDDKRDIIEKFSSVFSVFSSLVDQVQNVIKVAPIVGSVTEASQKAKHNTAKEFMADGLIICFDDFERKSSEINLNDLFGFVTNLALQYKATIVIILNDDVFEGKEKDIFTNVKEKSVSKYLMFNPICDELFEIIFKYDGYKKLIQHKEILKTTFAEVGIVNARILIQVLDNVVEWINKKGFNADFYLRYFLLTNINFILNHHIFEAELKDINTASLMEALKGVGDLSSQNIDYNNTVKTFPSEHKTKIIIKSKIDYEFIISYLSNSNRYNDKCIENIKKNIEIKEKDNGHDNVALLSFINRNESLIKSLHFMYSFELDTCSESNNQAEIEALNKINSFIETGIL